MSGIKHYLIDEIYPDEEFSVANYKKLALEYIDTILAKGKIPIVVGGTGLYISSLLYNINFSETVSDWELREKLNKEAQEKGNEFVHNMLKEIDPESAKKIHKNNVRRVIRAIEVYKYTNKPISYHQEISKNEPPEHEFITYGLKIDRQRLYERINKRVDIMISNGLINEVRNLLDLGYDIDTIAMQGLGYKEIIYYFRGLLSFDEAVYLLKRDTRRYAKRQITWFKRVEGVRWIDVEENDPLTEILKNIEYYIA